MAGEGPSKDQIELKVLPLNSSSSTLIFEYQMVSDYRHPEQKGNVITNTGLLSKRRKDVTSFSTSLLSTVQASIRH